MELKKGDFVFIKPHNKREDVICGIKPFRCHRLGGEFYIFIHYTNKDTAFVSRPASYCECVERQEKENNKLLLIGYNDGNDRILVPKDTMFPVFGAKQKRSA